MNNILQDPVSGGHIDIDSFVKREKKIQIVKVVRSPYEYYGCRSSYTCQSCGIEHIMDSTKASKGEIAPEGKRYISGPCSCGHRCECLPEIRYEYIDAPSPSFKLLPENHLKSMNGFAQLNEVLDKAYDGAEIKLKKEGNTIHLSYFAQGGSGMLYRSFEL